MAELLNDAPSKPLGTWLIDEGVLSDAQLTKALTIQKRDGGALGTILTHHGIVPVLVVHETLARQHGLEFVNLLDSPIEPTLINSDHIQTYITQGFIPYREEEHSLVIAVTDPRCILPKAMFTDKPIRFVMTSPLDIAWTIQQHCHERLDEDARHYLRHHLPHYSLTRKEVVDQSTRMLGSIIGFILLCALMLFMPVTIISTILTVSCIFFLSCLSFKLLIFLTGIRHRDVISQQTALPENNIQDLPVYTVLVPLFHEAHAIPDIVHSLGALDYPASKLDIKLIVEACDTDTIHAIKTAKPDGRFHMIIVPTSQPQTKPKACNYALRFARGEYITIYDAEDAPHSLQLRQAVATFRNHPDKPTCLQARLNYYNHNENLLTRLFSLEYAMLFDFKLPALYHLGIPIPLGGTSNHIRRDVLEHLGAWDPFNVTEDADLGVRLAAEGHLTLPMDSLTREEAPISVNAWVKQRSRWIKGYLQTWAVMGRSIRTHHKQFSPIGFWGIHFFIGAASLSYIVAPFLWLSAFLWLTVAPDIALPAWTSNLCITTLIIGACVQCLCAALTNKQRGSPYGIVTILCYPLYFILHSLASLRSVWQLCVDPYHWDKTPHSLSRFSRTDLTEQPVNAINRNSENIGSKNESIKFSQISEKA